MKFTTTVALRYVSSQTRGGFFSWMSILSILGIAIGVAVMIIVLSVIGAFEHEMQRRFLNANAHILAFNFPNGLLEADEWEKRLQEAQPEEVVGVAPFIHSETLAKKGPKVAAVLLRGVHPEKRQKVQDLGEWISPRSALVDLQAEVDQFDPSLKGSVILGSGVAESLQAQIGDEVELFSATTDGPNPVFEVKGIYRSGLKHYDQRLVAISLPAAQHLLKLDKRVTGIEIGLRQPNNSPQISAALAAKFDLTFKEWQTYNESLMNAMKTEKTMIAFIVCLVGIVASLNILTTMFIAVLQKQKEISVLKSLGATNRSIVILFLKQGGIYGVLGGLLGIVLAFVIGQFIQRVPFIDLPDPYYLDHLPVEYDPWLYLLMATAGVILCVIAALYPAYSGSKISPSLGLRNLRQGS